MSVRVIGCKVVEHLLAPLVDGAPTRFLDYGLHRVPSQMTTAIQAEIDAIGEPSTILLGYGLCGNGTVGLKAGRHTLVIPRVDDCISLILGSYEEYRREQGREAGTYFLSNGWIECGSGPLNEHREYAAKYGEETAQWLIREMYHSYRRVLLVGSDEGELARYEGRARAVADFIHARLEQRLGSDALVRRLVARAQDPLEDRDFVVAGPGKALQQADFLRMA